jgi:hypothetical protein
MESDRMTLGAIATLVLVFLAGMWWARRRARRPASAVRPGSATQMGMAGANGPGFDSAAAPLVPEVEPFASSL